MKDWVTRININNSDSRNIANKLYEQIKWLIACGEIKEHEKLPPLKELGKYLGISFHTVRSSFKKLEEDGLIITQVGNGTFVQKFNPIEYRKKKTDFTTNTIGVLVPTLKNPFYAEFLEGVYHLARKKSMMVFTVTTEEDMEHGLLYFDMLMAKGVDGIIFAPYGIKSNTNKQLTEVNKPIPAVYVDHPEYEVNAINIDCKKVGRLAAEVLVAHKHTHILIVTGKSYSKTISNVIKSFQTTVQALSDKVVLHIIEQDTYDFQAGYNSITSFDFSTCPISALFAIGDVFAIGAMKALNEKGIQVPQDISILGYNNIENALYSIPGLSTIGVSAYDIGTTSVVYLDKILKGEIITFSSITVDCQLIMRQSLATKEE